jgi:hypothetical protein
MRRRIGGTDHVTDHAIADPRGSSEPLSSAHVSSYTGVRTPVSFGPLPSLGPDQNVDRAAGLAQPMTTRELELILSEVRGALVAWQAAGVIEGNGLAKQIARIDRVLDRQIVQITP